MLHLNAAHTQDCELQPFTVTDLKGRINSEFKDNIPYNVLIERERLQSKQSSCGFFSVTHTFVFVVYLLSFITKTKHRLNVHVSNNRCAERSDPHGLYCTLFSSIKVYRIHLDGDTVDLVENVSHALNVSQTSLAPVLFVTAEILYFYDCVMSCHLHVACEVMVHTGK